MDKYHRASTSITEHQRASPSGTEAWISIAECQLCTTDSWSRVNRLNTECVKQFMWRHRQPRLLIRNCRLETSKLFTSQTNGVVQFSTKLMDFLEHTCNIFKVVHRASRKSAKGVNSQGVSTTYNLGLVLGDNKELKASPISKRTKLVLTRDSKHFWNPPKAYVVALYKTPPKAEGYVIGHD